MKQSNVCRLIMCFSAHGVLEFFYVQVMPSWYFGHGVLRASSHSNLLTSFFIHPYPFEHVIGRIRTKPEPNLHSVG